MPQVFESIESDLLTALRETFDGVKGADFCLRYHLGGGAGTDGT